MDETSMTGSTSSETKTSSDNSSNATRPTVSQEWKNYEFTLPEGWITGEDDDPKAVEKSIDERLGIAHVAGKYAFTDKPYLLEGAEAAQNIGFKTIKVWLNTGYRTDYPFNSEWQSYSSLRDIAASPYYKQLFEMDFTTYFLEVLTFADARKPFRDGMTEYEQFCEKREIYELSKYLLETYKGTGKTFILQNWEGDWYCANTTNRNEVAKFNDEKMQQGAIQWFNARQAGIDAARGNATNLKRNNVYIYGCAEINLLDYNTTEHDLLVDTVIPSLNMDLYSYSNWQTANDGYKLKHYIQYFKDKAPSSLTFGEDNVLLGEFGAPENLPGQGGDFQSKVLQTQTDILFEQFNAPYAIYWQLFCNEYRDANNKPANPSNEDMQGFWLIRPDGSTSSAYNWFVEKFNKK